MPVDPPTGYTDTSGQEPYNVALSLRRAACAYARAISDTKSGSRWKRELRLARAPPLRGLLLGGRPMIWAQLAYLRRPRRAR